MSLIDCKKTKNIFNHRKFFREGKGTIVSFPKNHANPKINAQMSSNNKFFYIVGIRIAN